MKKKYSVKQKKYQTQKRIGMVLIFILNCGQTYCYFELFLDKDGEKYIGLIYAVLFFF